MYRNSLKILRKSPSSPRKDETTYNWFHAPVIEDAIAKMEPKKSPRGHITSFTRKSKSRCQFVASNSVEDYISQMTLTYDTAKAPDTGQEAKMHLNKYLVRLRKEFPGLKYLWVLEFTKKGFPHFHLFTNIKYSPGYARFLGYLWNLAVYGKLAIGYKNHLKVHQYVPAHGYKRPPRKGEKHGAFCPWTMGNASYITHKYLSKKSQKSVPPHFRDVGRFWGASRGVVETIRAIEDGEFSSCFVDQINTETGEFTSAQQSIDRFWRDLRNFHEKRVNRARWKNYHQEVQESEGRWTVQRPKKFKSPLRRQCDTTIASGTQFYRQWFEYYQRGFNIPF